MRVNDAEVSLLKKLFAENPTMLKLVRKAMYKGELTEDEKNILSTTFSDENVKKLMRKMFLPEIEHTTPIGQEVDLWMTLKVEENKDDLLNVLTARAKLINLIEEGLEVLATGEVKGDSVSTFKIEDNDTNESLYQRLSARNTLIVHTEQQLVQITLLAGKKDESTDETIARLKTNSNK